jgi:hypothetical protein
MGNSVSSDQLPCSGTDRRQCHSTIPSTARGGHGFYVDSPDEYQPEAGFVDQVYDGVTLVASTIIDTSGKVIDSTGTMFSNLWNSQENRDKIVQIELENRELRKRIFLLEGGVRRRHNGQQHDHQFLQQHQHFTYPDNHVREPLDLLQEASSQNRQLKPQSVGKIYRMDLYDEQGPDLLPYKPVYEPMKPFNTNESYYASDKEN